MIVFQFDFVISWVCFCIDFWCVGVIVVYNISYLRQGKFMNCMCYYIVKIFMVVFVLLLLGWFGIFVLDDVGSFVGFGVFVGLQDVGVIEVGIVDGVFCFFCWLYSFLFMFYFLFVQLLNLWS